ncbi:hypothetical protein E6H29_08090 [Candidatus Bathyarchaeota archaeon]|nr:MAG: hypothetical protein E6H29_08090 [Candidatus Bathyarchaeota archaeon]
MPTHQLPPGSEPFVPLTDFVEANVLGKDFAKKLCKKLLAGPSFWIQQTIVQVSECRQFFPA